MSAPVRIGILEVGVNLPELIEEHGGFGDWFIPFLDKSGRRIDYRIYQVNRGEAPGAPDECDAWLVTGSEVSTYDDPPWQVPLIDFLRRAARRHPVIGICYGHQLLHHAHGGRIEKSHKGWGIGVQRYSLTETPEWMGAAPDGVSLLVSHQDQVAAPAPGSVTLGGSAFCPVGVSLISDNIFTMQPHPELKRDLARLVFRMRREEQGAVVTDAALASLGEEIDDVEVADWILSFIESRLDLRKSPEAPRTG